MQASSSCGLLQARKACRQCTLHRQLGYCGTHNVASGIPSLQAHLHIWMRDIAGMAALYATELAANHLFSTVASTRSMDEHGREAAPWGC
jgi:hypothetical protein